MSKDSKKKIPKAAPETIVVTQELLDLNPAWAEAKIKVGQKIEIPEDAVLEAPEAPKKAEEAKEDDQEGDDEADDEAEADGEGDDDDEDEDDEEEKEEEEDDDEEEEEEEEEPEKKEEKKKGKKSEKNPNDKLSKKDEKSLAKKAVAQQCQCSEDDLEDQSEKEEDGFAFKYKDSVFKVLLKQDFANTLTKCWNVVVEGRRFYIYLQKK